MMEQRPPRSQVSPRTLWTVGLNGLALALLVVLLHSARTVLSWVLVALFLALAAEPVVSFLERRGLRRGWAVAGVMLGGVSVVALLLITLLPMFLEQGRAFIEALPSHLESLRHHPWVQRMEERFHVLALLSAELRARAPGFALPVLGVVTSLLTRTLALITVVVMTSFCLLFGQNLFEKALAWVHPEQRAHWRMLAGRMHRTVGGYVAGAALIALIGGCVTAITLFALDVPYFLPLGLSMTVLGLIPFVGAFVGAVLVVGTTFLSVGQGAGLIALCVFLLYQQVENHFLQPLIQRRTLQMNPLLITLVMLVSTSLAGVLGALLALPVAGALQVLAQDRLAALQSRWANGAEERPSSYAPHDSFTSATRPPLQKNVSRVRRQQGSERDSLPSVRDERP